MTGESIFFLLPLVLFAHVDGVCLQDIFDSDRSEEDLIKMIELLVDHAYDNEPGDAFNLLSVHSSIIDSINDQFTVA